MIRLHWLRRCDGLALMLALGATSGCINSEKFTSGRLPYGEPDRLAATAPRDPFLTAGATAPHEQQFASSAPTTSPMGPTASPGATNSMAAAGSMGATTQEMSYASSGAPTHPAQNYAAMPAGAPQMQPPQYAMNAASAGAPVTDMRQAAYTPSEGNPFNAPPTSAATQMIPRQMQSAPEHSAIEQINYEMPVGMPAGAVYESNPFAEVEGQSTVAPAGLTSQAMPMYGATDAWQPSLDAPGSFAGQEFLPPR